jgi:hypothetical protein
VGGVSYPRQVPSVLDQHVLKSTSSSDQRDVPLARFPHNLVGRLRIAVGAAGPNNDDRSCGGDPGSVSNRVGGHNPDIDWNPSILGSMSDRGESGAVIPMIGRQIYQHIDDDRAHRRTLTAKDRETDVRRRQLAVRAPQFVLIPLATRPAMLVIQLGVLIWSPTESEYRSEQQRGNQCSVHANTTVPRPFVFRSVPHAFFSTIESDNW